MKNIPLTETEIKEIKDHYTLELEKIQKRANEITNILQKISPSNLKAESPKPIVENKVAEVKVKSVKAKKAEKPVSPVIIAKPAKPVASVKVSVDKKVEAKAAKVKPASNKKSDVVIPKIVSKKAEKPAKPTKVKAEKAAKTADSSKKIRKPNSESKKSLYEAFILDSLKKENKLISSKTLFDSVEKQFNVKAPDYSKMKATVTVILSKTKANGALKDYTQPGIKSKLYGLKEWFDASGKVKDPSKL